MIYADIPGLNKADGSSSVSGFIFDRTQEHPDRGHAPIKRGPVFADWTTRDCEIVTFRPGGPLVSEPFELESRFYERICEEDPLGDYEKC